MHGLIAYTDGSCLRNPGPGGWGVRLLDPEGMVHELGAAEAATTNNRMELQAALAALEVLHRHQQATIYTDSLYVINGSTKWLPHWPGRGWVTTAGAPIKNRDLWCRLASLNHAGICWRHVRAHTGDPNNERVDDIARAFASGAHPALFRGRAGTRDDPVGVRTFQISAAPTPSGYPPKPANTTSKARYVSIVRGTVALDNDWPACAARVRGVSGARHKKVRTPEELAAFCTQHGVEVPPDV